MHLDDLTWELYGKTPQCYAKVAIGRHHILSVWLRPNGVYDLYVDRERPDRQLAVATYFGLGPIEAQAILYHLLSGVTDERQD
jgi:hypothetical protein